MSEALSLEDIAKFWPQSAPDINNVPKYFTKYKKEKIVIKCGGNVLIDPELFKNFIAVSYTHLTLPTKRIV